MEPTYESVVDPTTLVWTLVAYGINGGMAFLQLALALYLAVSGVRALLRDPEARLHGVLRALAALFLLLPLLAGASYWLSLSACAAALVLLAIRGRGLLRGAAIACSLLVAPFLLYEREDAAALGFELISTMQQWRSHEVDWQQASDRQAPKLGELAPDFELQDPTGATRVRLSDYRGKRPVALVFGSYT